MNNKSIFFKSLILSSTLTAFVLAAAVFGRNTQEAGQEWLVRQRRASLSDEAERIIKDSQQISVHNVGSLVELVERHQASECLARVICELANNPHSHGEQGTRFAKALLNFKQSKHAKVRYYLDAMSSGAKAKNLSQCKSYYPTCGHPANEIISVGVKVLRA